jgi:acyl dehydratase
VLNSEAEQALSRAQLGAEVGISPWLTVSQTMIDDFAAVTLDPDPMHIEPDWARSNAPFGGTIAFGFLTLSLLTHLLRAALGAHLERDPRRGGYYLNYGFNRVRLIAPVRTGKRIRGRFQLLERRHDERQRLLTTFNCTVEIEVENRPALSAEWLTVWVAPEG